MWLKTFLKHFVDLDVVHHVKPIRDRKSTASGLYWVAIFTVSVILLMQLLYTVSDQFYNDQSVVSTSTKRAPAFPVLNLCPKVIPREVVRLAGYPAELAYRLNDIIGFREPSNEHWTTDHAPELNLNGTVQQALLQIARKHLQALAVDATLRMLDVYLVKPKAPTVKLQSEGYCFAWTIAADRVSDIQLRFMAVIIRFRNSELAAESKAFSLGVTLDRSEPVIPKTIYMANNTVNVIATWRVHNRRSTRHAPCSPHEHSAVKCMQQCIADFSCEGHKGTCRPFSPYAAQTMDQVCTRKLIRQCNRSWSEEGRCVRSCDVPCTSRTFFYSFTHNVADGNEGVGFTIMLAGSDGSLYFEDVKAVTLSMYISYIGGNLGCVLGINVFVLLLLGRKTFGERFAVRSVFKKWRPSGHMLECMEWVIVFALSIPFLMSLFETYLQKTTTAVISLGKTTHIPRILIFSSFLSDEKLKKNLDLPKTWMEEDERVSNESFSKPFMCSVLQALQLANPFVDNYKHTGEVQKLLRMIEASSYVKENGVEQLLRNSAYDPSERISRVVGPLGDDIPFEATLKSISSGFVYELKINNSAVPTFTRNLGEIRVELPRNMFSDRKCRRRLGLAVFFREHAEGVAVNTDFLVMRKDRDYVVTATGYHVKTKNTPTKPCVEGVEDASGCLMDCLDQLHPCHCPAMFYGEPKVAVIKKVSHMCHNFMFGFLQCQLWRTFMKEVVEKCKQKCHTECDRTFYNTVVKIVQPEPESTNQTISFSFRENSAVFNIEESFVYDISAFLCALFSIFSSFFGYSFISWIEGCRKLTMWIWNRRSKN